MGQVKHLIPPADRRSDVLAFFDRWKPDLLVWQGGDLHGTLLAEAEAMKLPLLLVDARLDEIEPRRALLGRMQTRRVLRSFDRLLASDEDTADRLKALGARPSQVEMTGPLEEGLMAPQHNEAERAFLAELLGTRPLWYAVDLPEAELDLVLAAHIEAMQRAHRYLLVLGLSELGKAEHIAAIVTERGFRSVRRSETDEVDSEDQIIIADLPGEHGLWYRLAPLTYVGGTLTGMPNRNPLEPAALGSAVLHGTRICDYKANFARLWAASASRALEWPNDLGRMLTALSAPDQSALLAHAAWDVSSRGAEVTDRVIALIERALEGNS